MKKVLAILLSFILLAGHMQPTIGTHFCGGEAVETKILLGETHPGCHMPDMEESCDIPLMNDHNEVHFDKVPCCENEYQTIQVTGEFIKDASQINVAFAIASIYTAPNSDFLPGSNHQLYTSYTSPPIEKDVQILFQTFLN